jgi:hypothetical protein
MMRREFITLLGAACSRAGIRVGGKVYAVVCSVAEVRSNFHLMALRRLRHDGA